MNGLKPSFLMTAVAFLLCSCGLSHDVDPGKVTSINILDRNGLSETIHSKDRLTTFENTDFLGPQPYQKVMRVFGREKNGDVKACITSYHPNGQVKQCLESINNRAFGKYQEWYPNGQIKIEARVIGGIADLNTHAEQSWLFEGINRAWDEEGHLAAQIAYEKGELEGESLYYHPNGTIWKHSLYKKNALNGLQSIYNENGILLQTTEYAAGLRDGKSIRYWALSKTAHEERYEKGLLLEAQYFSQEGNLASEIKNGNGYKAIFGKRDLLELQEFQQGRQEGLVKFFDEDGSIIRTWTICSGEKHGEEINYFPASTLPQLQLTWNAGILQGPMKTWYENGNLESQREISDNKKNGLLTAWYRNGALMLVEEYDDDKLIKGEYFRLGEKIPTSKIDKGSGIATLFNSDGNFSRKVYYQDGKPIE